MSTYRYIEQYDPELKNSLLTSINELDSHKIKTESVFHNIPLSVTNEKGENFIHQVIQIDSKTKSEDQRLNFIKFLISQNVNPDLPDKNNMTPLHYACKRQYVKIIKFLLENGVNPNFTDNLGNTPFHYILTGKLSKYHSNKIQNLIAPNKKTPSINQETINQLKKNIWDNIKNKDIIVSMYNTLNIFSNYDDDFKKEIYTFIDEMTKIDQEENKNDYYKEKISILREKIYNLIKKKWNDFPKLDEIQLGNDTSADNFYPNNGQYYIIKGINNIENHLNKEIINEINKLETEITEYNTKSIKTPIFNKDIDLNFNLDFFYKQEDLKKLIEKYNINDRVYNSIYDYINFKNSSFIGGGIINIPINLGNRNTYLKIIDGMNSENFYDNLYENFLTLLEPLNLLYHNINLPNYELKQDIFLNLSNVSEEAKNDYLIKKHLHIYFLNYFNYSHQTLVPEIYYYFISIINRKSTSLKLGFLQATILSDLDIYIRNLDNQNVLINFLSLLLTENTEDRDIIDLNIRGKVNNIYNNLDSNELDKFKEELVYYISKRYDEMDNKPISLHIVDIIFIIRKIESGNGQIIRNYLENMKPKVCNNIVNFFYFHIIDNNLFDPSINSESLNIGNILNNSILPSRKMLYLNLLIEIEKSSNIADMNQRILHLTMKFKESYLMGLDFYGCIEEDVLITKTEIDNTPNKTLKTEINGIYYDYQRNPFPTLNYLERCLKNNFIVTNSDKIRLINNKNLNLLQEKLIRKIKYLNMGLGNKLLEFLDKLNKNSMQTGKIFSKVYPNLLGLHEIKKSIDIFNDLLKENTLLKENKNDNFDFNIKLFVNGINKINAYYFMKHYFNEQNLISPFNNYRIPLDKPTKNLLYYNSSYRIFTGTIPADRELLEGYNYQLNPVNSKKYIENILNGNKFITTKSIDKHFDIVKNDELPPSLDNYYGDFYKFSILDLIIKKGDNLIDDDNLEKVLYDLNIKDEYKKVRKLYLQASLINELIKDYLDQYLKNRVNDKIVSELNSGNITFNLPPVIQKEEISFNQIESLLEQVDLRSLNEKTSLPFYRTWEKIDDKERFILYSDDYSQINESNIEFNEIKIKLKVIEYLLDYNANPFILNKENKTPIFMALENYNHLIFEELRRNNISFYNYHVLVKQENDINIDNPILTFMSQYKIHQEKLITPRNINLKKIFDKFHHSYFKYIENLIKEDENIKNNYPRYYKDSFNVIGYLINQYLTENIFVVNEDFTTNDLVELFKLLGLESELTDYKNKKFGLLYNIGDLNIPKDNKHFINKDILDELNDNKKRLDQKLKNLRKEKANLEEYGLNTDNIDRKITDIETQVNSIELKKSNLDGSRELLELTVDLNDIKLIKNYEKIINQDNRICYLDFWNKSLERLELDDINLVFIKSLYYSNNLLDGTLNATKLEEIIKELSILDKYYTHIGILSKEYFENEPYLDKNKPLRFTYDLLIHLTKNYLCLNIEMILRKIIYKYLLSKYPNETTQNNLDRIDYLFKNKVNKNVLDILYQDYPEIMVKSATKIFKNKQEKTEFIEQDMNEILVELINLLTTNEVIPLHDDTLQEVLNRDITNYYDLFSYKLIISWKIIVENYLKFVINTQRINKTLINLVN